MSSRCCDGTGFVLRRGAMRSIITGRTHKDAEFVVRCPQYTEYFREIANFTDNPETYPVASGKHVCDAASRTHAGLRTKVQNKDGGRRKRRSDLL